MTPKVSIATLNDIALAAGRAILEVYHHADFSQVVDFKADQSPLTLADQAAQQVIAPALQKRYPNIPLISEEGKDVPYATRRSWEYFWLVDPLDGTKEFIKRNGQFTVNIALIHRHRPVLGVIYPPMTEELYFAAQPGYASDLEAGGYKQTPGGAVETLRVRRPPEKRVAVRSSSHASEEEEQVLRQHGVAESIARGSSLKFCMIAEGKADIYYRHGPTMEWDTAAGQAIVEAAGGKVFQDTSDRPFVYNKESLRNGSFLVVA
jgi:3'(2'), 5'-bisphosphate nucleotidase